MEVLKAFGLVALGMLLNQFYNWMMWKKFYEGRKDGRGENERNEGMANNKEKPVSVRKGLPR